MDDLQKPQFLHLLATTLAMYGKSMPETAIAKAWITGLAPYPLEIVRAAMQNYRDENGEFAPVPAAIELRCKLMDGRPGVEEAWATALSSRDESNTVLWTSECASAFAICQPVLGTGNDVGARMAFKEVYIRRVGLARNQNRAAEWSASLGWSDRGSDERRANALREAACRGVLLPAPIAGLLEGPQPTSDALARERLKSIHELLEHGERDRRRKLAWREYEIYLDDLLYKALTNALVEQKLRETKKGSSSPVTADLPMRNRNSASQQLTGDYASPSPAAIAARTNRRLSGRSIPQFPSAISNGASHGT